jgi:hypothetical protein
MIGKRFETKVLLQYVHIFGKITYHTDYFCLLKQKYSCQTTIIFMKNNFSSCVSIKKIPKKYTHVGSILLWFHFSFISALETGDMMQVSTAATVV